MTGGAPWEGQGRSTHTFTRAVIFDLDGTVVDSHLAIEKTREAVRALVQAAGGRGSGAGERPVGTSVFGPPSLSELLREARDLGPEVYTQALRQVDDMERRAVPSLMEGVRETLGWLGRQRDLGLGLLTNSGRDGATALLERLETIQFFDVILCREDVPMLKPSPLGLRLALERLGCPARALYVGDSWIDARAAEEAGVPFVAFRLDDAALESRRLTRPWARAKTWPSLSRLLSTWLSEGADHGNDAGTDRGGGAQDGG